MIMSDSDKQRPMNVPGAILAWIWPGLGHLSTGRRRRGGLIMFGVLFLVTSGLLIGGFDAVDHRNDSLWFLAQVFSGPIVIVADLVNQLLIKTQPQEQRFLLVGLSHVNEIGILYIAMAGLMNFVAMLDALSPWRQGDLERRGETVES